MFTFYCEMKLNFQKCILRFGMIANASNFVELLIGRIFTGLGAAMGTSPAIVYITEVARPDLRGSLISLAPTLASLGKNQNIPLQSYEIYQHHFVHFRYGNIVCKRSVYGMANGCLAYNHIHCHSSDTHSYICS